MLFLRLFFLFLALVAMPGSNRPKPEEPASVTVCQIVKDPTPFSGRIVRIHGEVIGNFEYSALTDECPGAIDVEYPTDVEADVEPQNLPNFSLEKNDLSSLFAQLLSRFGTGNVLPTAPYHKTFTGRHVLVTFIGRIDGPDKLAMKRGNKTIMRKGFGHLGQFPARLVIKAVTSVTVSSDP